MTPDRPGRHVRKPIMRLLARSMQRIIGTEVEYGISAPGDPTANPIMTSTRRFWPMPRPPAFPEPSAHAGTTRSSRRCVMPVASTSAVVGPAPIIDADEIGAANMILTNGARLYVDHAHPEYSAPEVTDPLDAVIWDKAGERVMEAAARVASVPGAHRSCSCARTTSTARAPPTAPTRTI